MDLVEKIKWMKYWCSKNNCELTLTGQVGFGRDCVGITVNDTYPDYLWHNLHTGELEEDSPKHGDIWIPEDSYHKHPCVAVLGSNDKAISQLYDWLVWFDDNGYTVTVEDNPNLDKLDFILKILGRDKLIRMKKKVADSVS